MNLSKENLSKISAAPGIVVPGQEMFSLPEKVLQFGTGVLLRGLPDYLIDKANRNNVFNGRIVVVKSTDKGSTDEFSSQDGLYTVCIRGIEGGKEVDEKIINASVSRVLSSSKEWSEILACAGNKDMQVIISNTTETGIRLVKEDLITMTPPASFPGKLLAFLYERYKIFNGDPESGMVILPTELVADNGNVLKSICVELAELNRCGTDFIQWLVESNDFCSTLVDRIVPGALPAGDYQQTKKQLGYEDKLMIMAEPYCLWAIETSAERTRNILSFAKSDNSVVLADNINKHREIKLRLLNATHTFSCALAICCGFSTVKQALQNPAFKSFLSKLMYNEIIPSITGEEIDETEAKVFAGKVLDRFSNPFIDHEWLSISVQYTSKLVSRCIPLLLNYYERLQKAPGCIALGFAAYILFMNSKRSDTGQFIGTIKGKEYSLVDEKAPVLHNHCRKEEPSVMVNLVLSDEMLWNTDLTRLPEFEKLVLSSLLMLKSNGYQKMWHKELITL